MIYRESVYFRYLATQLRCPHWFTSQIKRVFKGVIRSCSGKGYRQRWVVVSPNEEASISEANKKGHYNRAMGSSNLFSWNMHARACLKPTSRASGHLLILITGLFAFPPFLLSLIGFAPRPYCWINRACANPKSLFFSPYLFFLLSFCCALAPCTLHLLAQSVAAIAEGPPWLGTVRPAAPSGSHCVGWRAFPSSGGYKHTDPRQQLLCLRRVSNSFHFSWIMTLYSRSLHHWLLFETICVV